VVDSERAGLMRDYLVEKLNHIAAKSSNAGDVAWSLKSLKESLYSFSANNSFRNIFDETAIKCKHGLRMVMCDKTTLSEGKLENRPMMPLVLLRATTTINEEGKTNFSSLELEKTPTTDPVITNDIEWIKIGSLITPSLRHCELTEWTRAPPVRSSHTTRTGPGGSSLCLTKMTIGDAVKAANRFRRGENTSKKSGQNVKYKWEDGSNESFMKRLPIGIAGEFTETENSCKWELDGGATVTYRNDIIEIVSRDVEEVKFLSRMIERRFPRVEMIVSSESTATAAVLAPTVDVTTPTKSTSPPSVRLFKVLKKCVAEEPGELDVDEGEDVVFLSADASGWTAVRHAKTGKIGYVPATYIRECGC